MFDKTYTIQIDINRETVEELKLKIEKIIGIPPNEYWLKFNNKILTRGPLINY